MPGLVESMNSAADSGVPQGARVLQQLRGNSNAAPPGFKSQWKGNQRTGEQALVADPSDPRLADKKASVESNVSKAQQLASSYLGVPVSALPNVHVSLGTDLHDARGNSGLPPSAQWGAKVGEQTRAIPKGYHITGVQGGSPEDLAAQMIGQYRQAQGDSLEQSLSYTSDFLGQHGAEIAKSDEGPMGFVFENLVKPAAMGLAASGAYTLGADVLSGLGTSAAESLANTAPLIAKETGGAALAAGYPSIAEGAAAGAGAVKLASLGSKLADVAKLGSSVSKLTGNGISTPEPAASVAQPWQPAVPIDYQSSLKAIPQAAPSRDIPQRPGASIQRPISLIDRAKALGS